STSAARRASEASSIEQQPRDPFRCWARDRARAMCTPTTSCPASTARAAATAESTPPERAASTRIRMPPSLSGELAGAGVREVREVLAGPGVREELAGPGVLAGPGKPVQPVGLVRSWRGPPGVATAAAGRPPVPGQPPPA